MKKVSIIGLIIVGCIILGGCVMEKKYTSTEIKEQMLNYAKDKYDEEFEMIDIKYSSRIDFGDTMAVYPKGGDEKTEAFVILRENYGDKIVYSDDYFKILIREEYEEYVGAVVEKYFPEYKLYLLVGTLSNNLTYPDYFNKNTTLEDAFKESSIGFLANIYVMSSDIEETKVIFEKMNEELKKIAPDANIILYGVNEEDFKQITRYNYEDDIYSKGNNSRTNFYLHDSW